jgi:UDP-N-acetylmuramoyl-tripeptide--D-alanyl-D-alanine ligase
MGLNVIDNILLLFLFAVFSVTCGISILHYIHMFQLCSYKLNSYIKWCRSNVKSIIRIANIIIIIPLFFAFIGKRYFVISGIIVLFLMLYCNRPRKAKKPLVYTSRIIRLIVTIELIVIAAVALSAFLNYILVALILIAIYWILPMIVIMANYVDMPIQKAINRWYYCDAVKKLRSHPNLIVIGVTGSYGKTSTKYFLYKLLSTKYNVLMTPESYNTPLGVVKTIRSSLNATHDIFIVEMGAKNAGDIKEICNLVSPNYGVITSVGPQHLETFKTIENVIYTKFELADSLPEDGIVFLNFDNEYIKSNAQKYKYVSYGTNSINNPDFTAKDLQVNNTGSSFTVENKKGETQQFACKLLGKHNIENILASIAVSNTLGISLSNLVSAVKKIEAVPHRLQLIKVKAFTIIDDAYNSNPIGSIAALDALSGFSETRILVTPGMVELGTMQDELNYKFGQHAAITCDYVILVKSKQTDKINEGLINSGFAPEKIFKVDTVQSALMKVGDIAKSGNSVALLENDLPDNY